MSQLSTILLKPHIFLLISGFRREAKENCAVLGYVAEDRTDWLFLKVDKKLALLAT
jgi:hypothetical protein